MPRRFIARRRWILCDHRIASLLRRWLQPINTSSVICVLWIHATQQLTRSPVVQHCNSAAMAELDGCFENSAAMAEFDECFENSAATAKFDCCFENSASMVEFDDCFENHTS